MPHPHAVRIARELELNPSQVESAAALLEAGASIPFVARYRKETTGSLDEVALSEIRNRLEQLRALEQRRESILKSLEQRGQLTAELEAGIMGAASTAALEDLYLPYRPKRRTRAMAAREKGLEPLARKILEQAGCDPETEARAFVDPENGAGSAGDALAGARDIIAEWVSEDPATRAELRRLFNEKAMIQCRVVPGREEAGAKFRDYFECAEPAAGAPSHRVLAMRRGEKEDVLSLAMLPPEEAALAILDARWVSGGLADSSQVREAVYDSYRRLLSRSLETELRLSVKERADAEAIRIFADNLRELLLAPPLGPKRVLAVDPGFRTGCKLVCLDAQGKLLHHETVFPHGSERQREEAAERVRRLVESHGIEVVAVGNGTGGRETERFLRAIDLPGGVLTVSVSESGASVYSASESARAEFPDLDLTVRGAVSIGRRLMDPLAELVKIDPRSIGVGQYQHDVDPQALKQSLDDVVLSCVNTVGVDLNQASLELLTYVSGLGPQLAGHIVDYRNAHGAFRSRRELLSVPRLGPKAFEQCAGFLRIRGGECPLDASAVHPERYALVDAMAGDLGVDLNRLLADSALRSRIDLGRYASADVGRPTLEDILRELDKPGRDPRKAFDLFSFSPLVKEIKDLQAGMRLPGVVTNVTAFGAFVDIGVHQDGLVHVSELAERFVRNPFEVIRVHQRVEATVLEVDLARRRIALSLRRKPDEKRPTPSQKPEGRRAPPPPARGAHRPFHNPFADLKLKR
jgi:uncharacterized protein